MQKEYPGRAVSFYGIFKIPSERGGKGLGFLQVEMAEPVKVSAADHAQMGKILR